MKNTIIILNKKLSLFFILFISIFGNAQEIGLINNTWYVHSMSINSQIIEAPRFPEMTVQAFFGNNEMLNEMCCSGQLELEITFDNNQSTFEVNNVDTVIENCTNNDLNNFRDLYIDFFQDNTASVFEYDIQELIANMGNYLSLTITNLVGDTVELYNSPHDPQVDYYIFSEYTTWYLTGIIIDGTSHQISYETASQTAVTFSIDGSFNSQICGEIISKAAFINDDGGGAFGSGNFYIPCENIIFIPGDCDDNSLTTIEQHYYSFLQNLVNGNIAIYQRGHADFSDVCGSIEIIELYDSETNSWVFLADCVEPLSTNTFIQNSVVLYPNPVNDILFIQTTDCNPCTVKIYTPNGKLLYKESLKASQDKIDVKELSTGIYFLVMENDIGTKQFQKFVKK
ncbi:MAG: hypothetical protein CVU03_05380 [Bacteroidetes bacterium HGW-Bacteroidetes-2]|jgi:hypothetical protein|nr:MAG: hypothetical protein CVU03_05380 [Bacteroidetes bacterium HGW-Bacteroidetes-2]